MISKSVKKIKERAPSSFFLTILLFQIDLYLVSMMIPLVTKKWFPKELFGLTQNSSSDSEEKRKNDNDAVFLEKLWQLIL